jgi:hypothetical protein
MWTKLVLASAVTGLLAGLVIAQPTPAEASRAECRQAAKAKFPGDWKTRREFKRYCIRQWQAYRAEGKWRAYTASR